MNYRQTLVPNIFVCAVSDVVQKVRRTRTESHVLSPAKATYQKRNILHEDTKLLVHRLLNPLSNKREQEMPPSLVKARQ